MAKKDDLANALAARQVNRIGRDEEASAAARDILTTSVDSISRVPTADLLQNPYNSRTVYTSERIRARAASLMESGQAQAILVAELDDGRRIVVDGWTRTQASRLLESDPDLPTDRREFFSKINAQVRTGLTMRDLAVLSFVANEEHDSLTDIDRGIGFRKVLSDQLFGTHEELAAAYRIDRTVVTKLCALAAAPPIIQEIILSHSAKLTYSLVSEVIGTDVDVQVQCKLLLEVAEQNKTQAWLRTQVALLKAASGAPLPKVVEKKLRDSTLKWASSPRAKSLEIVTKSKSEQMAAALLLEELFMLASEERKLLVSRLKDAAWVKSHLSLRSEPHGNDDERNN